MQKFALILLLLIAPSSYGDEIESQIELGMEAYQEGDVKGAIDELKFAIAQLQEKLNSQQATLLPDALSGWTAGEIENMSATMSMMGGGTNMARKYTKGKASIELSIIANSMMTAGIMAMINNPMLMNSAEGMSPYRYKRIKGTKKVSGDNIDLTLAVAGQIMVQLMGKGASLEELEAYLEALDFKALKAELIE